MSDFELLSAFFTLTAGLAYLNVRILRMPTTIGLMGIGLGASLVVLGLGAVGIEVSPHARGFVERVDFSGTLLHGVLGLFLFAGALHVDLADLRVHRRTIGALALGSTLISTVLVGAATYGLLRAVGHGITVGEALLFGALISPTDPIAVLGIFRSVGAPHDLEVQISGESLFNDGIAVVVFTVLLELVEGAHVTAVDVATLFLREALGGAAFGLAIGYAAFRLLRSIDEYTVEVLITLALVLGGYAAAERLHVSAPIAAVVAGLVIGNQGRRLAMSDVTRQHVDLFWKLLDEILNAFLFLMLGLEAVQLSVDARVLTAALLSVPIVLGARLVSVALPASLLRGAVPARSVLLLTWGGLRGGISVALAMSLSAGPTRDLLLVMTYAVVTASILGQGLTLAPLLRRVLR